MMESHVNELRELQARLSGEDAAAISRAIITAEAIDRGGWDMSPCMGCSLPVVCIPDGLPMCESCAEEAPDG